MTQDQVKELVRASIERFNALSPEEQEKLREAQRQSWVRGELGIENDREERKEKKK